MNNEKEHDLTKKMLKTLNEAKNAKTVSGLIKENDNDTIDISGSELSDIQANFSKIVPGRGRITSLKVYPAAQNVIMTGEIADLNGLQFQYTLEGTEALFTSVTNLQLTDNNLKVLQKLKVYYDDWAIEWDEKLQKEYKQRV